MDINMDKRNMLFEERKRLKKIEDDLRKDIEVIIKKFKPKYEYTVKKVDLGDDIVYWRGEKVNNFVEVDIKPAPGVKSDVVKIFFEAINIEPSIHIDMPKLHSAQEIFAVTEDGIIIPQWWSYSPCNCELAERSVFIEPLMRVWSKKLKDEKRELEVIMKHKKDRINKIETWIRDGYPNGELSWIEECEVL